MIRPEEIESIQDIGQLDGSPIQLIKTIGGFHIVSGRPAGKSKTEVLASGSHAGIVKHAVEKRYRGQASFQMMKSQAAEPKILDYTEHLPETLQKKGYELFSVRGSATNTLFLNKDGRDVAEYGSMAKGEDFIMKTPVFLRTQEAKLAQGLGVTETILNQMIEDVRRNGGARLLIGPFDQNGEPNAIVEIPKGK